MSDAVRLMRMRTDIERLARGQTTTRAELTVQVLNPVINEPVALFAEANECPRCGTPLPRVIYGYPNWDALHELGREGVPYVLGGCMVTPESPRFSNRCVRCD